jgi:glycosyltransferase involved in cell wall biosynthesis
MHILVLTHYFPPEVNAAANRFYEMARLWVTTGHRVTVLTCEPNHPKGVLYPGYRNRLWSREIVEGIEVIRIWTFLAANEGFIRRTLNYLSYFFSANIAAPTLPKADIIVSTSPQFFCGIAGYTVALMKRKPWVLDVRDLWPESIIAVGAMRPSLAIRALKRLEYFAYRHAMQIVSVSDAFLPHIESSGATLDKVAVVTNGIDLELFRRPADAANFRAQHGFHDKFVVGYVGTHGLAHRLETVLEAAYQLRQRDDIAFVLVGDGAERKKLLARSKEMRLTNLIMLPQVPRDYIPTIWASIDAALVHLRAVPAFENVIPSKMLEAFAAGKPVLLGVRGKAQEIMTEGDCGLSFIPENPESLAKAITILANDPALTKRLGENGKQLSSREYDRSKLAMKYLSLLESIDLHWRANHVPAT